MDAFLFCDNAELGRAELCCVNPLFFRQWTQMVDTDGCPMLTFHRYKELDLRNLWASQAHQWVCLKWWDDPMCEDFANEWRGDLLHPNITSSTINLPGLYMFLPWPIVWWFNLLWFLLKKLKFSTSTSGDCTLIFGGQLCLLTHLCSPLFCLLPGGEEKCWRILHTFLLHTPFSMSSSLFFKCSLVGGSQKNWGDCGWPSNNKGWKIWQIALGAGRPWIGYYWSTAVHYL